MANPLAPEEAVTELGRNAHSHPSDIADPDAEVTIVPNEQRYEHKATLGEGGMGEVRLCRDLVIGRDVALKGVLAAHAGRGEIRARFIREARVQGQLEHPAIVPVYDFGTDGEGRPFFTMKRVRGVTLESVLDALRRDDEATARLYTRHKLLGAFVQVCLAIDFAHERGVLHRDLKPPNVMLGGYGEVYVLDWGLAKVRSASRSFESASTTPAATPSTASTEEKSVDLRSGEAGRRPEGLPDVKSAPTAAGVVLGTPGYMAPEQIKSLPLDLRTDIYQLGGILFELLTLEPLHGRGSLAGIMKRTLEGVDARASVRAPLRDVPPELEALCVRACALDPAKRPATARELADGIDAYLSGDRDVELRKTLARTHLERAREASERALAPGAPNTARTEALREVGRAMAFDPGDDQALKLLVAMLTEPPKEPPPEVLEALETSRLEAQRRILPRVAFFYLFAWLIFLPVQIYLGVIDVKLLAMPVVAWSLASAGVLFAYRFFKGVQPYIAYLMVLSGTAMACSSVIFGPLILLPTMIVMSTMGTILVTRRSRRTFLLLCNTLALLVPTALAWMGKHPVAHVVEGTQTLRIVLPAFGITHNGLFGLLGAGHLSLFVISAIFAARYRDALSDAETKSHLHAWQLRQLVSREVAQDGTTRHAGDLVNPGIS